MERRERPQNLESRLNALAPQLYERAQRLGQELNEHDEGKKFEILMRQLESLLVESGAEFTQGQRDELRQALIDHGREIGWPALEEDK